MRIEVTAFLLPHIGDEYSQCADRFYYDKATKSFAIADGVGNSLFPGDWAMILCKDFVKHPDKFTENSILVREDELIKDWEKSRDERVSNLTEDEKFIFEMGLEKADFAASTFVGLSLGLKEWKCQAIGDSYLIVLNNDFKIIETVASMKGKEFDNYPEYFGSKKGHNNGEIVPSTGGYENVQYLVLMTDAISDWFLSDKTDNEKRKELLSLDNHQDYERFINEERQSGNLKDDDTSMLVLKLENDGLEDFIFDFKDIDKIEDFIAKENKQIKEDADDTHQKIVEDIQSIESVKLEIKKNYDNILNERKGSREKNVRKIIRNLKKIEGILHKK
jgi:hypothetical protein